MGRDAGIGVTLDAEEAERLELSLLLVDKLLASDATRGFAGFGLAVQAYQKRAHATLEWLVKRLRETDRRITLRLVKGAYWDSEIKRAQERGLAGYPVFTRKENTDVSYLACARLLEGAGERIYPQFATHNAHTIAHVAEVFGGDANRFEFQRLHGMGEALYAQLGEDRPVAVDDAALACDRHRGSAAGAMAALQSDPRGLLVDAQTADDLSINLGDEVKVLLARGTKQQTLKTFHVIGLFKNFPGFPQGTNLVANLHQYTGATGINRADFFLVRTTDAKPATRHARTRNDVAAAGDAIVLPSRRSSCYFARRVSSRKYEDRSRRQRPSHWAARHWDSTRSAASRPLTALRYAAASNRGRAHNSSRRPAAGCGPRRSKTLRPIDR
jgi:hypothetical protein